MAKKVLLRVAVMLACLVLGSWVLAVFVTTEVDTWLPWDDELTGPLLGIVWRSALLASAMTAGALWKLWLLPSSVTPN
nr:hypothetical protein [Propionicimonas sp.]